ncbi:hypothetical protein PHLCEN_2v8162 [Hermanssonia centrifuga]|uniref:Uncharacterized protein n=1 Tax=Hermanssonia centrifuga TaxID=98765 RepID=A0A2R6NUG8_9APHY|nr:hypothetical protein PHLCEN_2v8162 [Hermanssonia centrifuga]
MKTNTSFHSLPLPTGEALLVTERALRPMVQECISGIIRRAEMGFNRRLKVWASFTSGEDRVYMAHTRLSAVLQQVLIQDTINSFHSVEEQTKLKQLWIGLLYDALTAPLDNCGLQSPLSGVMEVVHGNTEASGVIRLWTQQISRYLATSSLLSLTDVIQISTVACISNKAGSSHHYEWSNNYLPWLRIDTGGRYHMEYGMDALYDVLEARKKWCLHAGIFFLRHTVMAAAVATAREVIESIDRLGQGY